MGLKVVFTEETLEGNPPEGLKVSDYESSPWGLDKMNLSMAAADFYLLMYLEIELDKKLPMFRTRVDRLADQFSRYTDMVIGGEFRHAIHKVDLKQYDRISRPLKAALSDALIPKDRNKAWNAWYFLRQRYGTIAIKWVMETFKLKWSGAYGGEAWANIADVLLKYETGEYSDVLFIDKCFALEHNTGSYFNKFWVTSGIKQIRRRVPLVVAGVVFDKCFFIAPHLAA